MADVRFAVVLFGLLIICSPAHAQDADQEANHSPSAEQPRFDFASLSRIDWVDFPARDEAIPPRRPGLSQQQPSAPHPEPQHTGLKALVFETANDFNAFPRRTSTWVILAIGGAAAAAAHPIDGEVNARLAGSDAAGRFFAAGKYIGSAYVQAGTAVGLYVVGRYVLPHAEGQPKTNKVSHLGFDLLRGLIVSQALTQGIKVAVRRDRPTGECCAFPSGHSSAAFATASVIERHLGYRGAIPTYLIAILRGAVPAARQPALSQRCVVRGRTRRRKRLDGGRTPRTIQLRADPRTGTRRRHGEHQPSAAGRLGRIVRLTQDGNYPHFGRPAVVSAERRTPGGL